MTKEQYRMRIRVQQWEAAARQMSVPSTSPSLLKYMRAQRCLLAWSSLDDYNVIAAFGMSLPEITQHMSKMGFVWQPAKSLWLVSGNRTAPVLYPSFEEMRDE